MGDIHLLLDTRGIQEYIFRAPKLKTVIGASAIIKELNEEVILKAVQNLLGTPDDFIVFNGGGNAQIMCPDQEKAEKLLESVKRFCDQRGIILISAIAEDEERARQIIRDKKRAIPSGSRRLLTPFDKPCTFCLSEPAFKLDGKDNKEICHTCDQKIKSSQNKDIWKGDKFKEFGKFNQKFVLDFDELKSSDSMMAIIAMDGNRIGSKFELSEKKKDFSIALDEITREAVQQTFSKHLPNIEATENKIFFRPLLLGGDDFKAIIDPKIAIEFVIDVCRAFSLKSQQRKEIFNGEQLTISAGIAVVHTKYPLWRAMELAEALLDNAKKSSPDGNEARIDFEIMTESGIQDMDYILEHQRSSVDEIEENRFILSRRPYEVSQLEALLNKASRLKSALARNQIRSLQDSLSGGLLKSNFHISRLLMRHGKFEDQKPGSENESLKDILFEGNELWERKQNTFKTDLLDLVILSELMKKSDGGKITSGTN